VSRVAIFNRNEDDGRHSSLVSSSLSNSIVSFLNFNGVILKAYRIGDSTDMPMLNIFVDPVRHSQQVLPMFSAFFYSHLGLPISQYLGCYRDKSEPLRDLSHKVGILNPNGQAQCVQACMSAGYRYAGMQNSFECMCGISYGRHGLDPNGCKMPCAGNALEICGDSSHNSVYMTVTDPPASKPTMAPTTTKPSTAKASKAITSKPTITSKTTKKPSRAKPSETKTRKRVLTLESATDDINDNDFGSYDDEVGYYNHASFPTLASTRANLTRSKPSISPTTRKPTTGAYTTTSSLSARRNCWSSALSTCMNANPNTDFNAWWTILAHEVAGEAPPLRLAVKDSIFSYTDGCNLLVYDKTDRLRFFVPLPKMYNASTTNNLTLMDAGGIRHFYIDLNANENVYCSTDGSNGDADLYMKIEYIAVPPYYYDCVSREVASEIRNFEACSVSVFEPMRVYVALKAHEPFSNLNLTCTVRSTIMYTSPITSMALGVRDRKQYYIDLAAGQIAHCSTYGSNGDADLYMKIEYPYRRSYDCGSLRIGSAELCAVAVSEPRRVYIGVYAHAGFNNLRLTCTVRYLEMYAAPITSMALSFLDVRQYYIDLGANQAVYCSINGPHGNADLYMKIGSIAIPFQAYDCRSVGDTSNEQCTVAVIEPKRVFVAVFALNQIINLDLHCTSQPTTSAPTFLPPTTKPA
jgi:hypothetical protein